MAYGEFEIFKYTGKPEDAKIYLNGNNNLKESFMALAQTPNEKFDLSPVYINVDGKCPWTNVYISNNQNTYEDNPPVLLKTENDISLFPALPNQLYSVTNMYTDTGTYFLDRTNRYGSEYYKQHSWFNDKQVLGTDPNFAGVTGNSFPLMRGNFGQLNPVTKFGSRSVILAIRVISGNVVNGQATNIKDSDLATYCDSDLHTNNPYVLCVQVIPYILNYSAPSSGLHRYNWILTGSTQSSLNIAPRLSFIPIMPNYEFDVITGGDPETLELSLFDAYVPSGKNNTYNANQNIFGSVYASNASSSVYKYSEYYFTFDDRCDFVYYTNTSTGVKYTQSATDVVKKFGSIDNFREEMRKSTAYFGLFFTEDFNYVNQEITDYDTFLSNDKMFLGTIDKNGVTHGTYTQGSYNIKERNFKSITNYAKESNVKPTWGDIEVEKTFNLPLNNTYNTLEFNNKDLNIKSYLKDNFDGTVSELIKYFYNKLCKNNTYNKDNILTYSNNKYYFDNNKEIVVKDYRPIHLANACIIKVNNYFNNLFDSLKNNENDINETKVLDYFLTEMNKWNINFLEDGKLYIIDEVVFTKDEIYILPNDRIPVFKEDISFSTDSSTDEGKLYINENNYLNLSELLSKIEISYSTDIGIDFSNNKKQNESLTSVNIPLNTITVYFNELNSIIINHEIEDYTNPLLFNESLNNFLGDDNYLKYNSNLPMYLEKNKFIKNDQIDTSNNFINDFYKNGFRDYKRVKLSVNNIGFENIVFGFLNDNYSVTEFDYFKDLSNNNYIYFKDNMFVIVKSNDLISFFKDNIINEFYLNQIFRYFIKYISNNFDEFNPTKKQKYSRILSKFDDGNSFYFNNQNSSYVSYYTKNNDGKYITSKGNGLQKYDIENNQFNYLFLIKDEINNLELDLFSLPLISIKNFIESFEEKNSNIEEDYFDEFKNDIKYQNIILSNNNSLNIVLDNINETEFNTLINNKDIFMKSSDYYIDGNNDVLIPHSSINYNNEFVNDFFIKANRENYDKYLNHTLNTIKIGSKEFIFNPDIEYHFFYEGSNYNSDEIKLPSYYSSDISSPKYIEKFDSIDKEELKMINSSFNENYDLTEKYLGDSLINRTNDILFSVNHSFFIDNESISCNFNESTSITNLNFVLSCLNQINYDDFEYRLYCNAKLINHEENGLSNEDYIGLKFSSDIDNNIEGFDIKYMILVIIDKNNYSIDHVNFSITPYGLASDLLKPFISYDKMVDTIEDVIINIRYDVSMYKDKVNNDISENISSKESMDNGNLNINYNTIYLSLEDSTQIVIENRSEDFAYIITNNNLQDYNSSILQVSEEDNRCLKEISVDNDNTTADIINDNYNKDIVKYYILKPNTKITVNVKSSQFEGIVNILFKFYKYNYENNIIGNLYGTLLEYLNCHVIDLSKDTNNNEIILKPNHSAIYNIYVENGIDSVDSIYVSRTNTIKYSYIKEDENNIKLTITALDKPNYDSLEIYVNYTTDSNKMGQTIKVKINTNSNNSSGSSENDEIDHSTGIQNFADSNITIENTNLRIYTKPIIKNNSFTGLEKSKATLYITNNNDYNLKLKEILITQNDNLVYCDDIIGEEEFYSLQSKEKLAINFYNNGDYFDEEETKKYIVLITLVDNEDKSYQYSVNLYLIKLFNEDEKEDDYPNYSETVVNIISDKIKERKYICYPTVLEDEEYKEILDNYLNDNNNWIDVSIYDFEDLQYYESGINLSLDAIKEDLDNKFSDIKNLDFSSVTILARTIYINNNYTDRKQVISNYLDVDNPDDNTNVRYTPSLVRPNGSIYHILEIENKYDEIFDYKIFVNNKEMNEYDIIQNTYQEVKLYHFELHYKLKWKDNFTLIDQFDVAIDSKPPIRPIFNGINNYSKFTKEDIFKYDDNKITGFNIDILCHKDLNINSSTEGSDNKYTLYLNSNKNYDKLAIYNNDSKYNLRVVFTDDNDVNFDFIKIESNLYKNNSYEINPDTGNTVYKIEPLKTAIFTFSKTDDDFTSSNNIKFIVKKQLDINNSGTYNEEIVKGNIYINNGSSDSNFNYDKLLYLTKYNFEDNDYTYYDERTKKYMINDITEVLNLISFNENYLYKNEAYMDGILINFNDEVNMNLIDKKIRKNGNHIFTLVTYKFNGLMNYSNYLFTIINNDENTIMNNNVKDSLSLDRSVKDFYTLENTRNVLIPSDEFKNDLEFEYEFVTNKDGNISMVFKDKNGKNYLYKFTEILEEYLSFSKYYINKEFNILQNYKQKINSYINIAKKELEYMNQSESVEKDSKIQYYLDSTSKIFNNMNSKILQTNELIKKSYEDKINEGELGRKKYIYGDVNRDGIVNAVDASEILTFYSYSLTENKDLEEFCKNRLISKELFEKIADVNWDGIVNSIDTSYILTYYSNKLAGIDNNDPTNHSGESFYYPNSPSSSTKYYSHFDYSINGEVQDSLIFSENKVILPLGYTQDNLSKFNKFNLNIKSIDESLDLNNLTISIYQINENYLNEDNKYTQISLNLINKFIKIEKISNTEINILFNTQNTLNDDKYKMIFTLDERNYELPLIIEDLDKLITFENEDINLGGEFRLIQRRFINNSSFDIKLNINSDYDYLNLLLDIFITNIPYYSRNFTLEEVEENNDIHDINKLSKEELLYLINFYTKLIKTSSSASEIQNILNYFDNEQIVLKSDIVNNIIVEKHSSFNLLIKNSKILANFLNILDYDNFNKNFLTNDKYINMNYSIIDIYNKEDSTFNYSISKYIIDNNYLNLMEFNESEIFNTRKTIKTSIKEFKYDRIYLSDILNGNNYIEIPDNCNKYEFELINDTIHRFNIEISYSTALSSNDNDSFITFESNLAKKLVFNNSNKISNNDFINLKIYLNNRLNDSIEGNDIFNDVKTNRKGFKEKPFLDIKIKPIVITEENGKILTHKSFNFYKDDLINENTLLNIRNNSFTIAYVYYLNRNISYYSYKSNNVQEFMNLTDSSEIFSNITYKNKDNNLMKYGYENILVTFNFKEDFDINNYKEVKEIINDKITDTSIIVDSDILLINNNDKINSTYYNYNKYSKTIDLGNEDAINKINSYDYSFNNLKDYLNSINEFNPKETLNNIYEIAGYLEKIKFNIKNCEENVKNKMTVSQFRDWTNRFSEMLSTLVYRCNEFLTDVYYNSSKTVSPLPLDKINKENNSNGNKPIDNYNYYNEDYEIARINRKGFPIIVNNDEMINPVRFNELLGGFNSRVNSLEGSISSDKIKNLSYLDTINVFYDFFNSDINTKLNNEELDYIRNYYIEYFNFISMYNMPFFVNDDTIKDNNTNEDININKSYPLEILNTETSELGTKSAFKKLDEIKNNHIKNIWKDN